ncbi:uncharacterized protein LOC128642210 [Bombina bombina]|uniref:uncharacterized protein LOC128642210 n=1 Tax=Bombina bombina TaxID=8345 RepID=UPI00235AE6A8|nr:uncharacterized protein LOC128642210 [Bombina bombina]
MEVYSGSQVLIPCSFSTNNLYPNPKTILMEWGFTPEGNDMYRPILNLYDTLEEQLKTPNLRAQVFVNFLHNGNCSLIINAAHPDDSGTYEVHIMTDGIPIAESSKVKLKVISEDEVIDETDQSKTIIRNGKERMRSGIRMEDKRDPANILSDPDVISLFRTYHNLKSSGMLYVIMGCGGFLILLLVGGSVIGVYFGCKYLKLRKLTDEILMEEGSSSSSESAEELQTSSEDSDAPSYSE